MSFQRVVVWSFVPYGQPYVLCFAEKEIGPKSPSPSLGCGFEQCRAHGPLASWLQSLPVIYPFHFLKKYFFIKNSVGKEKIVPWYFILRRSSTEVPTEKGHKSWPRIWMVMSRVRVGWNKNPPAIKPVKFT